MSSEANEYLAVRVLNEQQPVSYRNLSRALKVHVNNAKQFLADFHHKQNGRRPGSVHATYILSGTRHVTAIPSTNGNTNARTDTPDEGGDTAMPSSPAFPSSSMPGNEEDAAEEPPPIRSVLIVREEHLEQAKATFQSIAGMHIYSLQAKGLSDMAVLVDCNRRVLADTTAEDPLETWKTYGTIHNPHVKRRARGAVPPAVVQAAKTKAPQAEAVTKPVIVDKPAASKAARPNPAAADPPADAPKDKPAANKPIKKPAAPNSIFQSFAKQSAQPRKTTTKPTEEPKDVAMSGFSDDDDDQDQDGDDGLPEELKEVVLPGGKTKQQREADLQAMMDVDDTSEDGVNDEREEEENNDADARMEEADSPAPAEAPPKPDSPAPEAVTVTNGRRRGRRRVMKKKTVRDEEGYLVTREEPTWEFFSEDEIAPAPVKTTAAATTAATSGASNKKTSAAKTANQGNIMSFFTKK